MALKLYNETDIEAIADAIRGKNGSSDTYKVSEMADAIDDIPTGGGGGISIEDIGTGAFPAGLITYEETSIVYNAFSYRYTLNDWSFYGPNVTNSDQSLRANDRLKMLSLPKLTSYSGSGYLAFGDTALEILDFGLIDAFRSNTVINCTALNKIILRNTSLVSATKANIFTNTPFANGGNGGTIYIPKVLYDHLGDGTALDYKSASNWSTIDSYGTITWAQLEGSTYENTDWILRV